MPAPTPLRLVAWNIQHGGGPRAPQICSHLDRWSPDVCLLIEYRITPASRCIREQLVARGLSYLITTHDAASSSYDNGLLLAGIPSRASRSPSAAFHRCAGCSPRLTCRHR